MRAQGEPTGAGRGGGPDAVRGRAAAGAVDNQGNCPYLGAMPMHEREYSGRPGGETLCSCLALREAARHVTRFYDEALAPVGLGVNQFSVLAKLAEFGPSSLQELARILVMDRSTLGHLLRPLERRGLVRIAAAEGDRRQRLIVLTDDGAELFQEARPLWRGAEQRFQRAFGAARAADLRRLLGTASRVELKPDGEIAPPRQRARERKTE